MSMNFVPYNEEIWLKKKKNLFLFLNDRGKSDVLNLFRRIWFSIFVRFAIPNFRNHYTIFYRAEITMPIFAVVIDISIDSFSTFINNQFEKHCNFQYQPRRRKAKADDQATTASSSSSSCASQRSLGSLEAIAAAGSPDCGYGRLYPESPGSISCKPSYERAAAVAATAHVSAYGSPTDLTGRLPYDMAKYTLDQHGLSHGMGSFRVVVFFFLIQVKWWKSWVLIQARSFIQVCCVNCPRTQNKL